MSADETIFNQALDQADSERRSDYLQHACHGDEELRQRVEALLSAYGAGEFLESPAAGLAATIDMAGPHELDELIGTQIGPYKLLERIGEGGMGVVYMAQQTGAVKRKVALKLIKPGMDSRQVVARFEAERQALALMDHPNIARIFDAGMVGEGARARGWGLGDDATDPLSPALAPSPSPSRGRPYFVMELVRGLPITEYCDLESLDIRRRLELFIDVCRAVQHAHQKGIIHRDLKPTNVLVTLHDGVPVVKVIDFGVAKALNQELTEQTLFTQFAQMIGTPLYMSPEQAELSGLDVDTRSDVYSLGVLLYELLTGTTPFDQQTLAKLGLDEMRRIIREQEPQRPSARLSTLQAHNQSTASLRRSTDPRKLHQLIRGELDWIVMKALEKDRNRRYESPSSLAADIQRYLDDVPIVARPPTWLLRARKWCRRHPLSMVALTAGILMLCGLLGGGYWHSYRLAQSLDVSNDLRQKGLERERTLGHELYASDMRRAWFAAIHGDPLEARRLLERYQQQSSEVDDRGFEWGYLWRFSQGPLQTLRGHEAGLLTADVSPDDRFIASGDRGGTVKVWDLVTGSEVKTLRYSDQEVTSVRFSPDGKYVATAGQDRTVHLWDVASWTESARLEKHEATVCALAWSPDSKHLASAGRDKVVHVWKVATRQVEETLPEHSDVVRCLAWSPDGRWLASADGHEGVQIWEAASWKLRGSLPPIAEMQGILTIAFSSDSRRLAYGGYAGPIRIFGLEDLSEVTTLEPDDHVWSLAFTLDGDLVVGAGRECRLLHRNRHDDTFHWVREGIGESGVVRATVMARAGALLITASEDERTIKTWETAALFGRKKGRLDEQPVDLLPGRKDLLATTPGNKTVLNVRRPQDGSLLVTLPFDCRYGCFAACSPQGDLLAGPLPQEDHAVALWDMKTWQLRQQLASPGVEMGTLAFSADGAWLAAAGGNGVAGAWNLATGAWHGLLSQDGVERHANETSIAFSPTENLVAAARTADSRITFWRPGRNEPVVHISAGQSVGIDGLAFSPDGRILAAGESGRLISLWDVSTGKQLGVLRGHEKDHIRALAFSPNGRTLASACDHGSVRLWNVDTRRELFPILQQGHPCSLAFRSSHELVVGCWGDLLSFDIRSQTDKP